MRQETLNIYSFSELSEDIQEKVLNDNRYRFVEHGDWYDFILDDAKQIGVDIQYLDVDRNDIRIKPMNGASHTAHRIVMDYGESTELYKLAKKYQEDYNDLVERFSDGVNIHAVAEGNEYDFDQEADALEDAFFVDVAGELLSMFKQEYEHQLSDEYLEEMFEINEYEFTAEGRIY